MFWAWLGDKTQPNQEPNPKPRVLNFRPETPDFGSKNPAQCRSLFLAVLLGVDHVVVVHSRARQTHPLRRLEIIQQPLHRSWRGSRKKCK